eukprot:1175217-Amphidinium_carterae.1
MTKYLETAKIKKHSEAIGLHPYLGNRSTNMITRGQLRPRGSYMPRPRGPTPQPRQRLPIYIEENEDTKVEEIDDLTGQQYFDNFVEEAARDDINNEHYDHDVMNDFNKQLQYLRQFLRPLLSVGRLCDNWRRRPIQGTMHFVQRHEQDLKYISTRTKTLLFITMTLLRSHFAKNYVEKSSTLSMWEADTEEHDTIPLDEQHITYLGPIEGDTEEDQTRLQQMRVIDDDMQSMIDENIEECRRREEQERQQRRQEVTRTRSSTTRRIRTSTT